jgi:hypothetical protein
MNHDDEARALSRRAYQRAILISAIACLALIGLGSIMLYVGMTFVEPAERLATRSVPQLAPIALSLGGLIVALGGSALVIFGKRSRS